MALSKKAKRRLTKLIEFMESLRKEEAKHFDMEHWVGHGGRAATVGDHGLTLGPVPSTALVQCGMTACALGWAATIPSFMRAGLKNVINPTGRVAVPKYEGLFGYGAASAFFDIDDEQVEALFEGTNNDPTPKAWAKRVRKLLKEWEAKA